MSGILEAAPSAARATLAAITKADTLEQEMLKHPQIECETAHLFATNTYVRQITMPAETIIVGHRHLTDHVNNIVRGKCLVVQDGEPEMIEAPNVFVSKPGIRKALLIIEETVWQTVHVIDLPEPPQTEEEHDALVERMERELIEPSTAWLEHYKQNELVDDMRTLTHHKQ